MKTKWMLLLVGVLAVSAVFVVAPWQVSREVMAADPKPLTQEFKPTSAEKALIAKHVYGGLPSRENIYVRQGYVLSYAPKARCPQWTAYHVTPDYRKTPHRIGDYAAFNDARTLPARRQTTSTTPCTRGRARRCWTAATWPPSPSWAATETTTATTP